MVPSAEGLGARNQARESKATCTLAGPGRSGRVLEAAKLGLSLSKHTSCFHAPG